MKIKKVIIENFRAFKHVEFELNDFNCIIGKNDAGKSTLLAALEWFFHYDKKLNRNDFAIAGENDSLCNYPDDFIISVEVHFEGDDVTIPEGDDSADKFIFSHDYIRDNCVCIKKKMFHPASQAYGTGYYIKNYPFKKIRKILSNCSVDDLVNLHKEIGELDPNANQLLSQLESLKKHKNELPKGRGIGQFANDEKIKTTTNQLKKILCGKLYEYHSKNHDEIIDNWDNFDNKEATPFYLEWLDSYNFHIYTSQTPISTYLNSIFTPYNTTRIYNPINEVKTRTAEEIANTLTNNVIGQIAFDEKERINIFTEDSLVFKHDNSTISIPLKNRGEGIQLSIKIAVFKLLVKIYEKNQNAIFAFEEPETHLHPSAQLEIYKAIKVLSENPNHQVIITTHSPYIVKELAKDHIEPIVVIQKENSESTKDTPSQRVLPYVSMNEINYIAFDEPSIEYHIELYGYMQNKLNKNVSEVDSWLKGKEVDGSHVWYDTRTFLMVEPKTLPYCVRNNIDHPLVDGDGREHEAYTNNNKYNDRKLIKESIEIMRNTILNNPNDFA